MFVSTIVIAFLVHTPLTSAALRLLTCRPVHAEDNDTVWQMRLVMDLDVDCSKPANLVRMLAMALPMILVVSLGIPFGAAAFLRSVGPDALQEPGWRNVLGFLVNGYRKQLYFWESVVLIRKVFLAFVTTTLAPAGGGMPITTALIDLLVALVVPEELLVRDDFLGLAFPLDPDLSCHGSTSWPSRAL
jgi:hypothetical protein